MAKLFRNIFLVLIPILLLIYLFPIKKEQLYASLELDCTKRGVWMYDRLYNNDKPIDIAFIGSSRTINGISEEHVLQAAQCNNLDIVNVGYCRLGRNLSYVLLKEILINKPVKAVVLEVREDEDRYSHPVFPYLANSKDVLGASLLFNRDYLVDNWQHFTYRCQLIQEQIFGFTIPGYNGDSLYGFMASDTLSSSRDLEIKKKRQAAPPRQLSNMSKAFYMKYPASYLEKITALCKEHAIKINFLYLPQYASSSKVPMNLELYNAIGTVLVPKTSILNDRNNWHDENHFNVGGAVVLSEWLGNRLTCNGTFK